MKKINLMKKKTTKETPAGVENINSIHARHKFVEDAGVKLAIDEDGNIFLASSYDSLIRKIRDRQFTVITGCSKAAIEDQKRLDFLNVMLPSFESGFTSYPEHNSPFIASAVGGAFTNVREAIDSLMSDTKRVETVVAYGN
tara:strand:- start:12883 stop:13305 length:423 start_codon:yes stop_codon:yes gene_type:complete